MLRTLQDSCISIFYYKEIQETFRVNEKMIVRKCSCMSGKMCSLNMKTYWQCLKTLILNFFCTKEINRVGNHDRINEISIHPLQKKN